MNGRTRVTALPDQRDFDVAGDETVLEAALRSRVPLAHACGGRAKCSTCRVWVLEGLEACPARNEREQGMADRLGFSDEVRLACQLRPAGALRLRRLVLDETDLMLANQLERAGGTRTGEVKNVTLFFSDVVGFTALSERLLPYDVMYLLNRYFAQAGEIVERNGGFIDKFVGDGMMAIFGVEDQPDAPLRAVNAALQTLAAVDRMKPFFKSMYGADFDIRIGLHYGEAVIGSLGSPGNERLTAIGDAVNVASRVEAANKDAGTRLLITDALHEQVNGKVEVADFVRVRLRGTSERITLHEIAKLSPDADAEMNAAAPRETMHLAGRTWLRLFPEDELAQGERRVLEFEDRDVLVVRKAEGYFALNNACPHLNLPLDARGELAGKVVQMPGGEVMPESRISDDLVITCRWHLSSFDMQTGEVREWAMGLDKKGASPGLEVVGDVSKNRCKLRVYPCHIHDGHLWIAMD